MVTARNGDTLLLFRPGVTALDDYPDLPLIFSCVVALGEGKVLFVYNLWRQEWELPAGRIEPGETPHEAGIRELYEESAQEVSALTHAGTALLRLSSGTLEMGAMFTCELEAMQPFVSNEETSGLVLLDLRQPQPVTGPIDELSVALVELVMGRTAMRPDDDR